MATPDVRVRLSAEGQKEIVNAFRQIQAEADKAGGRQQRGFGGFNKVLGNTTKLLGAVGIGITTIGALRGMREGLNILREWETRFAEIKTISSATDAELAVLERRLLSLGSIIPQNASLLAKGYYQVLSSGITDSADALYFLTRAGKAATAGITEIEKAVDVGTSILNAYGLEISQTDRIFDSLFTTVREGKITFDTLSSALGPAIPFFKAAGFEFEELLAGVATLTKGGFPVEQAVTSLKNVVSKLIKPTEDAKNAAAEMGIEFTTAAASSKGLVKFLAEIQEAAKGDQEAIARLFPDTRGLASVLTLAGAQADEFATILGKIETGAGAAQIAFDKMNETQAAQEQLLRNRLKGAWIELGRTVQDATKGLLAGVGSLLPKTFEEQAETLDRLSRQMENVDNRGRDLADAYTELVQKNREGKVSNEEVTRSMRELAAEFPQIISQMNELGEVTGINVGNLALFRQELDRLRTLGAAKVFAEQAKKADELRETIASLSVVLNNLQNIQSRPELIQFELANLPADLARGVAETVQGETVRLRTLSLAAQAELADTNQKLAQALVSARLAGDVIVFDAIAQAVEDGIAPASRLDLAFQGLDDSIQILLQTANPDELKKRLREMARVLREVDPELSFLGTAQGPALPPAAGGGGGTIKFEPPTELVAAFEEAQRRQREALAEFLNTTFGLSVTEGFVSSLEKSRPALFAYFSKLFADSATAGADLERRILEATGNKFEADLLRINAEVAAADERLRQASVADEDRLAQLERLRSALTNVAKFDEAQRQAGLALDEVIRVREGIEAQVEAGLISQEEGEKRIVAIERERLVVLRDLAEALLEAAKATGDPAQIAKAQEFADKLRNIGQAAKHTTDDLRVLKDALGQAIGRGLTQFFDDMISGSKSLKEAFRDMALSILDDLRRILTQMLINQALGAIGLAGGGSPAGRARGGLLGGLGGETSDSNLAYFSRGEYLVRAAAVRQPGVLNQLEEINRRGSLALRAPDFSRYGPARFAAGGLIEAEGSATGSSAAGRPDALIVGLDEGLVLRSLDTPSGRRLLVRMIGKTRRSARAALGGV